MVAGFNLWRRYSRGEIHDILGGGSKQSYLPSHAGRILCGCFDPGLNRQAPYEIDVGYGPVVVESAQAVVRQRADVPVFLKRGARAWQYVGLFRAVRYSDEPADLQGPLRRPETVGVIYFERADHELARNGGDDPFVPEMAAVEGGRALALHLRRERDRTLVEVKRREHRALHGQMACDACGLAEDRLPEGIGEGCFEVHHTRAIGNRVGPTATRLVDLALVCANCHRMIHRSRPMVSVAGLTEILRRRGTDRRGKP